MQNLDALKGKSLAELREIAKALGIKNIMIKKRELIEKIIGEALFDTPEESTPQAETTSNTRQKPSSPSEPTAPALPSSDVVAEQEINKPRRGRRPRVAKIEPAAQGVKATTPESSSETTSEQAVIETPTPISTAPATQSDAPATVPATEEVAPTPKRRGRKPKAPILQEQAAAQASNKVQTEPISERNITKPSDSIDQNTNTSFQHSEQQPTALAEEIITKDDFAGEIEGEGVLEVMPDGYGFLRSAD